MNENDSNRSLSERLGVTVPVWSAPMATDLPPEFVAAVSESGGLGVVPADDVADPKTYLEALRKGTDKPFAVALRAPDVKAFPLTKECSWRWARVFVERYREAIELSGAGWTEASLADAFLEFDPLQSFEERFRFWLEARPAAMISTFGAFREPEEDALRVAGVLNVATATTLREAKVARAARVDAIVVQGAEAGGPRWSSVDTGAAAVGLMSLLPHVKRATGLPLIAAGGIVTPEQVRAAKVLGADACLVGSAFLTTEEARADGFYQWAATESSPADYMYGPFEGTTDGWYLRNDFVSGLAKEMACADRPPAGLFEPWTAQLRKRLMAKGEGAAVALSFGQAAGRVPYVRVADVVRSLSA